MTSREGLEEGKTQVRRGNGLSPTTCGGSERDGLRRESAPLQSEGDGQEELRG